MKPLFKKSLFMGVGLAAFLGMTQTVMAGYEPCYEQEYQCHTTYQNECHNENQCYTVPGQQQCHQVRQCTPRPSEPNCQEATECGTNAQGEQICKTRQVCNGSSGGGEDCGYINECNESPSHQECTTQQRCEQVPRETCGYETVQKSCYVPDPTPTPQPPSPPPYYPPNDPTPPPYYPPTPDPGDPSGPVDPSIPASMGPQSVTKLQLKIFNDHSVVAVFEDRGQSADYDTQYSLTVKDASGNVVLNGQRVDGNGQVQRKITLSTQLPPTEQFTLVLKVRRTGGYLSNDVIFKKTFDRQ